MKRTDLSQHMQRLIDQVPYASVATVCADGMPWCSPLYVCFDDNMDMYWASWTDNQHSKNIASNPAIFVAVYDTRASAGEGAGLYVRMRAKMLTKQRDIAYARQRYTTNFGESGDHSPFVGSCVRRLYRASPLEVWSNDGGLYRGQYVDIRHKIPGSMSLKR